MFSGVRRGLTRSSFRMVIVAASLLAVLFMLYFWKLGSLTSGLSPAEKASAELSSSLSLIIDNPVNAPYHLLQFGLHQLDSSILALRLSSVLFMMAFLALFYLMLKLWFGRVIATLSTLILAASPMLIVAARNATPEVMFLAPLAIIAEFLWMSRRKKYLNIAWLVFVATVAVCLYIPGIIWLVVAGLILKWRELGQLARSINAWMASLSMLVFLGLIVPLVMAAAKDPSIVKPLFLIPDHLAAYTDIGKSLGWSALALIWRLPYVTDLTVGRLPLLSITQIAMTGFGLFAMWSKARRETLELSAIFAGSLVLAALNERLTLLIPAIMVICIFTAAGLRYLYVQWNNIFPRNPIPRGFAVAMLIVLVGIQLIYGWRYALVAWPNSPATRAVYVIK